jgi:ceramide glucosyltransferase
LRSLPRTLAERRIIAAARDWLLFANAMQHPAAFAVLSLACLWNASAALSLVAISRSRRPCAGEPEGVTVLKPLCGIDTNLRENLRSFFTQDHPRYELLFGVEGEDDPAIAIVRELIAEHPEVRASLVIHCGGRGINPKVSNLRATIERQAPRYDLLLISDSNASVTPSYVRDMESTMRVTGAGLVTSVVCAEGAQTLGAALDNAAMNSDVAPGIALLNVTRMHAAVLGKSMLFRHSVLDRLGGFESVASLLAEDYVLGRMFAEAGYGVAVAREVVRTPSARTTVRGFFQRHVRWAAMRWRLAPTAALAEPLTRPLAATLVAIALGMPPSIAIGWGLSLMILRDAVFHGLTRGRGELLGALLTAPLRELAAVMIAVAAPFARDVRWRGKRVRLSAGTRLYLRAPDARERSRRRSPA